jgi:hypothetical protein
MSGKSGGKNPPFTIAVKRSHSLQAGSKISASTTISYICKRDYCILTLTALVEDRIVMSISGDRTHNTTSKLDLNKTAYFFRKHCCMFVPQYLNIGWLHSIIFSYCLFLSFIRISSLLVVTTRTEDRSTVEMGKRFFSAHSVFDL